MSHMMLLPKGPLLLGKGIIGIRSIIVRGFHNSIKHSKLHKSRPVTHQLLKYNNLLNRRNEFNVLTGFLLQNRKYTTPTPTEEVEKNNKESTIIEFKTDSNLVKDHLELSKQRQSEISKEEKKELQQQQNKSILENFRTIGRILQLGKSDLKLFLLALAFILCAVLYPTTAVRLVGASLDAYSSNTKDEDGNLLVWGYKITTVFQFMVPFMLVSAACFWGRLWVLKVLGERLVARLRFKVMKTLLRHDAAFYDNEKHKVGDLISRLSSDAYVVSRSITGNLPDGLKNLLFGIISSYMMYAINPLLFGVFCIISPPLIIGSVFYGEKMRKLSTRVQNAAAGLTKVSEETLNSVRLVKAFTGEQKELDKYSEKIRNVVTVAKREAFAQSNYLVSIYALYHTGYIASISLGLYLILKGQMTAGDVVAFSMYLEFFNLSLYSLTTTYMELMKGAGAGVKLFELMDYKSDIEPIKGHKAPSHLKNDVEFKDVFFSYPTRPKDKIFNGCNFHIEAGASTCIVAPSGCGKSTVASLLLRSYNIQGGTITIGGKDIKDIQVRELRRKIIGIVQQEPVLLSGTILENIVYGLTPHEIKYLTMDDIIEVCKQANCHDFITGFPDGYNTIIGAGGTSLSGGQKQRVAIARALIKKPSILILDEATSALDSRSESLINETLKELTSEGKMTIISIAHRLSTISKSEFVVVLGKNGQVVEHGRFVELFSNPNSELSKLLDESANLQEDEKLDNEEVEEIEHLNREAQDIELEQKREQLEHIRSLIEQLPSELKGQLIEEINNNHHVEEKPVANLDSTLTENLKR